MTIVENSVVFCPACGARYTIADDLLTGEGLRVLC